jgi:PAS domain S-box-containing protein
MAGKKILIIEDESLEMDYIQKMLESFGYDVHFISLNDADTIETTPKIQPDLILINIKLKEKFEKIDFLKNIKKFNIPLIFLTTHSDDDSFESAKKIESYGYLVNLYDPIDLKNTIEFALHRHSMDGNLQENEKYKNIIENLKGGYLRADNYGIITMANTSAAHMFNYTTPEEMIGKSVLSIYRTPDARKIMLEKLKKHSKVEGFQFEAVKKDGTTFKLSINSQPYYENERNSGVESFLWDANEPEESEKKIEKLYRLYSTLSQISHCVVKLTDQESFFKTLCNVCVEFGKFQMAWVGLIDEKTGQVIPVEHAGLELGYLYNLNVNINRKNSPSYRAMNTKKLVLIKDLKSELNMAGFKESIKSGFKSMAVIPIKLKTQVVAMLYIHSSEENFFTHEALEFLHEISMDVSYAISTIHSKAGNEVSTKTFIENEESYRELVDNSIVAIYRTNLEGDIVFANPAMANFLGYESVQELSNINVKDLCKDQKDGTVLMNRLLNDGNITLCEVEMVTSTGKITSTLLSANLIGNVISWMMMDITQLKDVETDLKNSENKFRALVENASDALIVHSFDGNLIDVNRKACESLGYTREELLQMNVEDIDVDYDITTAQNVWEKIKPGEPHTIITRWVKKDGTIFPVEINFATVDINGEILYMGLCRDITQRIKAENEIRASEEKYHSLFDHSMDALILSIAHDRITDVNKAAEELFGYEKEEFLPLNRKELLDPDETRFEGLLNYRETKNFFKGELVLRKKNGDKFTAEVLSSFYRNTAGDQRSVIQVRDITPRKIAEKIITQSENRYRKVGKLISDYAFSSVQNDEGIYGIDWITESFYSLVGYNREDMYQHENWNFMIHPDDLDAVNNHIYSIKPGMKGSFNFRIISKEGKIIWLEYYLECVEDNGKLRLYGAAKDITEIQMATSKLKLNEEKLKAIINNSNDLIRILDKDCKIVFDSPSSTHILGYPEGSLVGTNPLELIHPDDVDHVKSEFKEVFNKNNSGMPTEFRILKSDGTYLPVESIAQNMFNVPSVKGIVVTTRPIKLRKEMENAIKSSLQEKEILLKEIHHRVKNNMQIILSLLNLQKEYVDDAQALNVLQESQIRVRTMSLIHEKLYQSKDLMNINIKDYIEQLANDIIYSYAATNVKQILEIENTEINIETALPCGLIISELISNSLKYAFSDENNNNELKISLIKSNDTFGLTVSDNGVGLPPELDYRNTESLGLQLVNNLVGQLDGEIELDQAHGTEFNIIFNELPYKPRI